jgi:alkylation response protein AidB-like acyl-CoA dehydrogenase
MARGFLGAERDALERWLPGLDEQLRALPLEQLERPGSPAIELFRKHGGAALLIPTRLGGKGADLVDVVRIHRALGSRSPSLAVAACMHNFTTAALLELNRRRQLLDLLLGTVANQNLLMASGFAEGQAGISVLDTNMFAEQQGDEFVISGSKKPCSLAHSMDVFTAHIKVMPDERRAYAVIPATTPRIERKRFWSSPLLAGAESDEVSLDEVRVPAAWLLFADEPGIPEMESWGSACFQLIASASYLGAASALFERALGRKLPATALLTPGLELESAMAAIEGVARSFTLRERDPDYGPQALFVRYAVQGAIERASMQAAELAGGMAYIGSPELSYLLAAVRALAFHPPSRLSWALSGVSWLRGVADQPE